jgi:2-polyprenyl-3-methyl-5-hydroxy-6-metoxy-1,4-benzoquinol methylase
MPEVQTAYNFLINKTDVFANEINAKANELYQHLLKLDASRLDTASVYKDYFIKHHSGNRLFFSLQNSAHIIYQSVIKTGKEVKDITFMDYGAGLGTLFMLAGMMGFKKTVYNDYFTEWHQPAKALCGSLQITIDDYVAGDIEAVAKHAADNNIIYDIIASRNVIEHIYSLEHFYTVIYKHNSKAVTFSTTTANYHNPVMRWYHIHIHHKWEKIAYKKQRAEEIKKMYPAAIAAQIDHIAVLTRGKGQKDFIEAVKMSMNGKAVKQDSSLRSNSCDCITGVWNEHLLTKKEYQAIISNAGFKMDYTPGYWDTHYTSAVMNMMAKFFNTIILRLGNRGIILSPFVNVIAYN